MYFYMTKGSTLPYLRLELTKDGRNNYRKAYLALQAADVTFTMTELSTGIKKIANAPAYVVEKEGNSCDDEYCIEYRWQKRDTSQPGTYIGQFKIIFDKNITAEGYSFPEGEMTVPITEDLVIVVNDSMIKK